jgi:hypothetical protein
VVCVMIFRRGFVGEVHRLFARPRGAQPEKTQ